MKIRKKKKGIFTVRKQRTSDRSYDYRTSMRLAYFELIGKRSFILKRRGVNNVIVVCASRIEANKFRDCAEKIFANK